MKALLDESQVSELLGLTPRQVLNRAQRGLIPCVVLSKNEVRFDREDLERWVAARKSFPDGMDEHQEVIPSADEVRRRLREATRQSQYLRSLLVLARKKEAAESNPSTEAE